MFPPVFVDTDRRMGCEFCAKAEVRHFQSATPRHSAVRVGTEERGLHDGNSSWANATYGG